MAFFSEEQLAILKGSVVRSALLFEMQFVQGTKRLWNGYQVVEAGGHQWTPMMGAGTVEGLSVPTGTSADQVTFTISGLPEDAGGLLAEALAGTPDVDQRMVVIYMQLFDEEWQTIGNPIGFWWGFMQPPKISRSTMSETAGAIQTVSMSAENAFFNRSRPPFGRYTDRDQQARAPGDKFFQFTPQLLFKTFDYPQY